jgi:hypothetical protein
MTRFAYLTSAAFILLGLAGSPAAAQSTMGPDPMAPEPDPSTQLMTDCDVPSLEDAAVDSCLERARVLQGTNPTPDVEALTVRLEQRSVQRFDPNSVTPPSTQAKAAAEKLDEPGNVTTPPDKMLNADETNSADTRPSQDAVEATQGDGAVRPVQGAGNIDDVTPPNDDTKDPPPPDTPSLQDDPPH